MSIIKFNSSLVGWSEDKDYNIIYLKAVEQMCNDHLRASGFTPLLVVYQFLNIPVDIHLYKKIYNRGWKYRENLIISFNIYPDKERPDGYIIEVNDEPFWQEPDSVEDLLLAQKILNEFCEREYWAKQDFSKLEEVPILYSMYGDDEEIEVQVTADLINHRLIFLKRDHNSNEEEYSLYKVREYKSLKEMIELELKWMSFDDLYSEYEF